MVGNLPGSPCIQESPAEDVFGFQKVWALGEDDDLWAEGHSKPTLGHLNHKESLKKILHANHNVFSFFC